MDTPAVASSGAKDELQGKLVAGRYRIEAVLGSGGMGRVYLAEDVELRRQVAVKVLAEELAASRVYAERFRSEARAAAFIGHPNIVQVLELGRLEDGRPFIAMERLEGHDLADEIEGRGPMAVERAVDVAGQVLFALSATHEAGVVHRDLKPENVFLCPKRPRGFEDLDAVRGPGGGVVAKVLDFGISRFLDEERQDGRLTRSGLVMGTPYYMAPEQVRRTMDVDARADLYAVGAILFHCLTGCLPFEADNVHTLLHRVLTEPTPDALALRPDLPPGLARVIGRAMARDPDERFATAAEMVDALRPFAKANGERGGDAWGGARPAAGRPRGRGLLLALGATLAIVAVGVATFATVRWARSGRTDGAPAATTPDERAPAAAAPEGDERPEPRPTPTPATPGARVVEPSPAPPPPTTSAVADAGPAPVEGSAPRRETRRRFRHETAEAGESPPPDPAPRPSGPIVREVPTGPAPPIAREIP